MNVGLVFQCLHLIILNPPRSIVQAVNCVRHPTQDRPQLKCFHRSSIDDAPAYGRFSDKTSACRSVKTIISLMAYIETCFSPQSAVVSDRQTIFWRSIRALGGGMKRCSMKDDEFPLSAYTSVCAISYSCTSSLLSRQTWRSDDCGDWQQIMDVASAIFCTAQFEARILIFWLNHRSAVSLMASSDYRQAINAWSWRLKAFLI